MARVEKTETYVVALSADELANIRMALDNIVCDESSFEKSFVRACSQLWTELNV